MTDIPYNARRHTSWKYAGFYILAIILGTLNGYFPTQAGISCANFFSEVFIRLFSFVSIPIIGVTICLTIANLGVSVASKSLWKKTLLYTTVTTIISATVAATLYMIISPENYAPENQEPISDAYLQILSDKQEYLEYVLSVIPNNILSPIVNGGILSVLLMAIAFGIAIRYIRKPAHREAVVNFLGGLQEILFIIVTWIIKVLPIGIFSFISICVANYFSSPAHIGGLISYFSVVVGANLVQGLIILPLFLIVKGLNPLKIARGMAKALTVAFFSKSSAGTLPVTMDCAENKNGINPKVSRFVLPICTTINMNGCAAFILTTVIFLMQNNGTPITLSLFVMWIFIATVAAIGNAGVPMGCFFLSASLLSSMGVPIEILGVILPVYTVIDMVETSLNVWSDSCVASVVNKELGDKLDSMEEPEPASNAASDTASNQSA